MSMNKSDSDHLLVATGISKSFGRVEALAPLRACEFFTGWDPLKRLIS